MVDLFFECNFDEKTYALLQKQFISVGYFISVEKLNKNDAILCFNLEISWSVG